MLSDPHTLTFNPAPTAEYPSLKLVFQRSLPIAFGPGGGAHFIVRSFLSTWSLLCSFHDYLLFLVMVSSIVVWLFELWKWHLRTNQDGEYDATGGMDDESCKDLSSCPVCVCGGGGMLSSKFAPALISFPSLE